MHAGKVDSVVGDEQGGGVQFVGQTQNQFDNARATFLVKGAGGFINQERAGVVHQGTGYVHPLSLPAGELVGSLVAEVGETDCFEERVGPLSRGGSISSGVLAAEFGAQSGSPVMARTVA